ncbi:MAG: TIGR00282 family metallophosphoesterase [Candidatus Berkelbacteria bacterium]|nr:TIGR00282 family metallophosphoesterase [Candidatus Berkelbacteria bacterium]
MKVLFFGDVFGRPGRSGIKRFIEENKTKNKIDLVIANVDNVASGRGPTQKTYRELLDAGVDVMTSGDHIWDRKEVSNILEEKNSKLLRPLNYPKLCPGKGSIEINIGGIVVLIVSMLGRVWTTEGLESPFDKIDEVIEKSKAKIKIIDFHAEATSEKIAFGRYVAGRVSAVLGTHTHVQTADERIINKTALISDVGFCGPNESVIGVEQDQSIKRFRTGMPVTFDVAEGPVQINAVVVTVDDKTGETKKIERIFEILD